MQYKNHRIEPYFSFVKSGLKTIECRIRRGKYKSIKPSDHIVIFNNEETDSFKVIVKGVRNYKTFRELLEKESLKKAMPDADSIDSAIKTIYQRFYTREEEKKFGVVAIEVQRI